MFCLKGGAREWRGDLPTGPLPSGPWRQGPGTQPLFPMGAAGTQLPGHPCCLPGCARRLGEGGPAAAPSTVPALIRVLTVVLVIWYEAELAVVVWSRLLRFWSSSLLTPAEAALTARVLGPCTHVGDLHGPAPGPRLRPGPVLFCVAPWHVGSESVEGRRLPLSLTLPFK